MKLPPRYTHYLQSAPPMFGDTDFDIGVGYEFELLDGVEQLNQDVSISEIAPGFLAFATDGGNELFVFDCAGRVNLMPMVGMAPDSAVLLADSFTDFVKQLRPDGQ